MPGLPHLHLTQPVEPLGVHFGEADGHVLDNDHAGNIGGQALEHLQGGLCSSGGGPQADDGVVQAGVGLSQGNGGPGNGGGSAPGDPGAGGSHDFLGQGIQKGLAALDAVRLSDKVHRSGGQRVKHLEVEGGDQDHRKRPDREQLLEKVNAVHAGHLHIQGHYVGLQKGDFASGVQGVDGVAGDFQIGVGGQPLDQKGAGHGGVVHHENANLTLGRKHGIVLPGRAERSLYFLR